MRSLLYDPNTRRIERGKEELLTRWKSKPDNLLWLDFDSVSNEHRKDILEGELGLHPLAIEDALRQRHPPKVERFEQVLFLLLRELDVKSVDIHFGYVGVSIFIGPNFLLTRSTGPSQTVARLWDALEPDSMELASPSALALRLADGIVRRYLPLLLDLEPKLDTLEGAIFADPDDALLAELTEMKSRLKELRRIFTYHGQVFRETERLSNLELVTHYEHDLTDIAEQVNRSASLADLYYELAADLTEAYLGLSAHRLNHVMQVLTIITVIFVPLSFLAGIYGMNFDNMPELHSRFGYFVLLGTMACVVSVQIYFFRKKRWL